MTSKVLCCYAQLSPETAACLALIPEAELVPLGSNPLSYWHQFRQRWDGDHDLIIIEQDMTFTPDQVNSLRECDQPWCVFGYAIGTNRFTSSLGFTKLSAELRRTLKGLLEVCDMCQGEWWHLDIHLARLFSNAGYTPHDHGTVGHLHKYDDDASEHEFQMDDRTRDEMKRQVSDLMKSRGWKGPSEYNGHDHTSDCDCVWTD